MELRRNSFKQALAEGRTQIGLWLALTSAYAAEVVAGAGFDWLVLDMEHSPNTLDSAFAQLQAVAPYPAEAVVRPSTNDVVQIKLLLDMGAQTLLVPYVQTVEEAQAAVAAMRYPPRGLRGVASATRAAGFGRIADYGRKAEAELCLLVQVETAQALERLEAIAGVDGVDGVFIGPADLAASMGLIGQLGHPQVKGAVLGAIGRLKQMGKAAGVLSADPDFAEECLAAGATFVAVGLDAVILARGTDALVKRFSGGS